MVRLCGQEEDADNGVKLLAAIRAIFNASQDEKLTTRHLLDALVAIEDGPWAAMFEDLLKHDRLQTAASRLARPLKKYHIRPRTLKLDEGETAKGYHRADFEPAWSRYLPDAFPLVEEAVTAVTAAHSRGRKGDG